MQYSLYKYEKGKVNLEFSFKKDDNEIENKKNFLELLKIAQKDLEKEYLTGNK